MKLPLIASIGIACLIWLAGLVTFNNIVNYPLFEGWLLPVGTAVLLTICVTLIPEPKKGN